ncbi:hypothetical protein PR202_gb25137 [Eleusine coracana subsp. coracana]|uniref:Inositol polyphosphate-related phosphatase domain-containing protein n=1 Tax=Eleusine coracana subsp. coracana TaxID=191504 RepID=A0AAV5FNH2_ELECO|nr:hypothetical protein PR202_gb25137 [Eleusine coracana subsp. coracana]
MKKWFNLRNSEFHSDCINERSFGGQQERRRKSCSDRDGSLLNHRDLSGGWLVESSENLRPAPRYGSSAPPSSSWRPPKELRMFVGTWNVGGRTPHGGLDLSDWLTDGPASSSADMFQEIVPLNAGNVLGAEDKGPALKWLDLIRQALNSPSSKRSRHSFPYSSHRYTTDATKHHDLHHEAAGAARMSFSELLAAEDTVSEPDDDDDSDDELSTTSNPESSSEEDARSDFSAAAHGHGGGHYYRLAASKQMVGIFLCVWVRADLMPFVTSLKVACVGRGIMGYMGNKGSISVSLALQGSATMCFVCTHLASGEKDGDEVRRNSDVAEILKRTRFPPRSPFSGMPAAMSSPETILEHDKVIWLGDLNYRLTSSSGSGDEAQTTQELLERSDWQKLLERDQLRMEQRAGRVFGGWEEGRIGFPPTYKYLADSDAYAMRLSSSRSSRDKKRTPAWCDRILWRGEGMEQLWYARGESRFSDHRPVSSLFLSSPTTIHDTPEEMLLVSRSTCPHYSSRF